MKHLVYYDAHGCILRQTGLPDGMEPEVGQREKYLVFDDYPDCTDKYVANGNLVSRPAQPSPSHCWNWNTKQWTLDLTLVEQQARTQRARLLLASDWTQLPDVPLDTKAAWADYRQALRDVPAQPSFPTEITWPTPPT